MALEVNLNADLASDFSHGRTVVSQTAIQVITGGIGAVKKGVQIKRGPKGKGTVYIGKAGVTAGDTVATDGMPIQAGEGVFLPIDDPTLVYAIGTDNNLDLFWAVI